MFGSQILEVAIGLALVYMILSLICSSVNEWIASRLGMRAKCLDKAIRNLLGDSEKVKKFYKNHLIAGLMDSGKLPSYIPSSTFALALLDVVAPSDTAAGTKTFADVKDTISKLPECEIRSVLLSFFVRHKRTLRMCARILKTGLMEQWNVFPDGTNGRRSGSY